MSYVYWNCVPPKLRIFVQSLQLRGFKVPFFREESESSRRHTVVCDEDIRCDEDMTLVY